MDANNINSIWSSNYYIIEYKKSYWHEGGSLLVLWHRHPTINHRHKCMEHRYTNGEIACVHIFYFWSLGKSLNFNFVNKIWWNFHGSYLLDDIVAVDTRCKWPRLFTYMVPKWTSCNKQFSLFSTPRFPNWTFNYVSLV